MRRLDECQPPQQAGFRIGYGTIDHIHHTVQQIIQKTEEYKQLLCLALVDYEKAYDSVEVWSAGVPAAIPSRLAMHPSDDRCLYESATMSVQVQNQ
jgi:hypothetical protein